MGKFTKLQILIAQLNDIVVPTYCEITLENTTSDLEIDKKHVNINI